MQRETIILEKVELCKKVYEIPKDKLQAAIKAATDKLASKVDVYMDGFPGFGSRDYKYPLGGNQSWLCGMHTGCFLLAYELTGEEKFLKVAQHHLDSYKERVEKKIKLDDHDVGFVMSPSCVALYKLTGNEEAKRLALEAAEHFYNVSYSKEGGFVVRCATRTEDWAYRTMMDTLLNIPLLYWSGKEAGIEAYTNAANSQIDITLNYLIRKDGSSFHHYQFDRETHKPLYGLTWQGNSDASCWSRGHAWGILGLPIAYSYSGNEEVLRVHKDMVKFMLNNLPKDYIPYWDYDFQDGDMEPRDSSAAVISACGLMDACKYLPGSAEESVIYKNVAAKMLEAVIDHCTGEIGVPYDGLINQVTGAKPQGLSINECAIYGDYFYLEALLRYIKPDWNRYW